ncbi:MAG TPA: triose-phosphate isomerase [Burkholderiales bacterium]|jgi:triosephosphate isomerase|nr:triose-phosphate isomerase [Burkholderiales bacterium]
MRTKLVVGNWKMNGGLAENERLLKALIPQVEGLEGITVGVCAPFPYLAQIQSLLLGTPIASGAQAVSHHSSGAYTGEVAGAMLSDFGCRFVIVGHSERRAMYGESDEVVADKFIAAQRAGLTPILCVGELLEERQRGVTEKVIARQLDAVVSRVGIAAFENAVLAYEPVWAIGTGQTATPEQAQAVHAFIRDRLKTQDKNVAERVLILYGGSVKASNAAQLCSLPDVDGGLVGGASLSAQEFADICRAAVSERINKI